MIDSTVPLMREVGINHTFSASAPLLVVVTGPTAVGKTQLVVSLASHFNSEVISADSRQFYNGMHIGTAIPEKEELEAIPHHFIQTHSISDTYSVYRYEADATALLDDLFKNHTVVFLTGGSGLYIKALCEGIDELPDPDIELRRQLESDLDQSGLAYLQQKLKILDPDYYNMVDLKNPARILRALEVCLQTGKPYSASRIMNFRPRNFRVLKIALTLTRSELNHRINLRVDNMCQKGLFEEVASLREYRNCQALKTVGYRELFEYFDGKVTADQAIESIKVNTRRYARKQMTWIRREQHYYWFHPSQQEAMQTLIELNI